MQNFEACFGMIFTSMQDENQNKSYMLYDLGVKDNWISSKMNYDEYVKDLKL